MIPFLLYVMSVTFVISVAGIFVFLAGRFALRDGGDLLRASMGSLLGGVDRAIGVGPMPRGSVRLRHLQVQDAGRDAGVTAGQKLHLHARIVTLGRSPGNDIVLTDPDVSSQHLSLSLERGEWWVTDRGSTNGTRLYRASGTPAPVEDRPERFEEGDIVQIGSVRLRLIP